MKDKDVKVLIVALVAGYKRLTKIDGEINQAQRNDDEKKVDKLRLEKKDIEEQVEDLLTDLAINVVSSINTIADSLKRIADTTEENNK